ncbi:MAG: response regulator [Anaerolineae bacterium]|nr:response regulator [Anaerolineae bacterium]
MSQQRRADPTIWLHTLRHRVLDVMLGAGVGVGALGVAYSVWRALISGQVHYTLPVYLAIYLLVLVLFFVRRIPDVWRAVGVVALLYGFACFALYAGWLAGNGRALLLATVVGAATLIGPQAGFRVTVLSLLTYAVFGLAYQQGWLSVRAATALASGRVIVPEGVGFALALCITAAGLWFFRQALSTATGAIRDAVTARALLDERAQELEQVNRLLVERTHNAELARQEAEVNRRTVEAQIWQTTNLAQLNDILRGEQDLVALATRTLRHLCHALNVPVGALFIRRGDDLWLAGSHAYTQRKNVANRFRVGEGLVGQAVLERQPIILTQVPAGYMPVTTASVELAPKNVVVMPILHNGQAIGAVELGTVAGFPADQALFLEKALESVGIALNTAQVRQRIDDLLAQTQKQAAELQAREADLRTMNRELQAQQSEMEAANADLEEKAGVLAEQRAILDQQNRDLLAAQRALEQRAEELVLANKYKSEFLANMSHELRTPLNSLLILARLLANNEGGNLTEEQVESARVIYHSGSDLLDLINEILDLSKVEAGRMEFRFASMSLAHLAESMRIQFEPLAREKNLDFSVTVAEHLPLAIETDQQRVEQITRNLLSNAFKFTEEGYVRLEVECADKGTPLPPIGLSPDQTVIIRVLDSGIGITPEQRETVFEAFEQADGSTARKYGGTGLGLTISRELATRLGGQIELQSEPGQGSVFTLYLPFHPARSMPGATPPPPVAPAGQPALPPWPTPNVADDRDALHTGDRLLLIVEDDPTFARLVVNYAHGRHFKCLVASDGESSLDLAKTHRPDAIILDLKLPGVSGWDVLDALKENPDTRHIPVHIMSALDETLDAYKMGAIGFLTKPATPKALDGAFQKIEAFVAREIKSLLVVEDDAALRCSIRQLLGGSDVRISEAERGQDALKLLRAQHFDCLILDLNLADMSGFEFLSQMHADETVNRCPVIVYTGQDLTEEENLELHRYADSVIVKGVKSPERLLDETALFLHRVVADMPEEKRQTIKQLHDREAGLEGKHILVVDDDMRGAFALSRLLGEKGLKVTIARNGTKALELLAAAPDVDLVLMDIMMPDLDGYETIRHIRARPHLRSLPILALTAKAMKGDQDRCIAAGANDYLSKPVDADRLFSMLRVWLYR